jgi:hypothetical protein
LEASARKLPSYRLSYGRIFYCTAQSSDCGSSLNEGLEASARKLPSYRLSYGRIFYCTAKLYAKMRRETIPQ